MLYKQRKKIVCNVLIHLCGLGESRDKLASDCNVPLPSFKRLIKEIRNSHAGGECQKYLNRFTENPLNIPKLEDGLESAWSSQVNKMIESGS